MTSIDVRYEQIARYRAENPAATEHETLVALDYEEYRRIIAEQTAILEVREKRIRELRCSVHVLRETVARLEAELERR